MSAQRPDINIASDDINALIHSYLVDSGFIHSAFVLRGETNLDRSPLAKVLFPRGQLTELLAKALLYIEVETHWKQGAGSCNEPFSLTGTHKCKLVPGKETSALATALNTMPESRNTQVATSGALNTMNEEKRKGKRAQREDEDDAMDDSSSASTLPMTGRHELPSNLFQFIPAHEQEIFQCAWNPVFTDLLATGSKDSYCHILQVDPSTNDRSGDRKIGTIIHCSEIPITEEERDVSSLEWNRDGTLLATSSMDPYVRVWSKEKRQLLFSIKEHTRTVGQIRFSPNGKYLLSVGLDSKTVLWDVEKKEASRTYQAPREPPMLQDMSWTSDTSFALTWPGFLVHVFVTTAPMPFRTFRGHTDEINMVRVSPDRKLLASISDDSTIRIWNIRPFKMMVKDGDIVPADGSVGGDEEQDCLHILRGHRKGVMNCRWGPFLPSIKEKIFISVSDDRTARVWDVITGNCLAELTDHWRDIYGLGVSPCGEYYATASVDSFVHIYSSKTWELVCSWTDRSPKKHRKRGVYEVDWHKDGKKLAVCGGSGNMVLLDLSHLNAQPAPVSE